MPSSTISPAPHRPLHYADPWIDDAPDCPQLEDDISPPSYAEAVEHGNASRFLELHFDADLRRRCRQSPSQRHPVRKVLWRIFKSRKSRVDKTRPRQEDKEYLLEDDNRGW